MKFLPPYAAAGILTLFARSDQAAKSEELRRLKKVLD